MTLRPQRKRRYRQGSFHRVLNFKQFVLMKDDEISPDKAAEEYTKYLCEFLNNEITLYYDTYEDLPFFREKYHPYYLKEDFELIKRTFLSQSAQFIKDYESGKYKDLLFEVSIQRLYGKQDDEDVKNLADASYECNEWAYEVPLEYPNEDTTKRLPLISPLESVVLVDVPEKVFKFEIVNAVKHRIENFIIYVAERDMVRTAFITVPEDEDIDKVVEDLNNERLTVQEFLLRFARCNPKKDRIVTRVCPPICSHPVIIMRDLELTKKLIRKLDADLGKAEGSIIDLLPEDLDIKLRLDIHILYLRIVHCYCYYGRTKTQNYIDLWDLSGPGHVRVDLTNDLYEKEEELAGSVKFAAWGAKNSNVPESGTTSETSQNDEKMDIVENKLEELKDWQEAISSLKVSHSQLQWLKDVESFALHVLNSNLAPPEYVEDAALIEEKWQQFCNLNTLIQGPAMFRCKICNKLFNDAKFVWKHLKNKHPERYEQIIVESGVPQMKDIFFNAHRDAKCNPFERLLSIPVIHKPPSDFDTISAEFFKRIGDKPYSTFSSSASLPSGTSNKKRRREYYDFDQPKAKKDREVTFAADEYSRPSVKYDDL
ncbi:conserved hypothetical protein [Theileria equi strain WA]|uniref:C2H2-type domain-containing protein n=1 Tax=Theileria equi strain WA TaxID=1537102 RepID=L1L989_THEEQ|nr:conserved hypothetical protein [Theileria equi strain WA]EKX72066.1 conserved hypothetical protein [Theileria equi strain WA]|eukprot:XP_004831518.1 conserved hypothetical protein [Theileria equi strain WA]